MIKSFNTVLVPKNGVRRMILKKPSSTKTMSWNQMPYQRHSKGVEWIRSNGGAQSRSSSKPRTRTSLKSSRRITSSQGTLASLQVVQVLAVCFPHPLAPYLYHDTRSRRALIADAIYCASTLPRLRSPECHPFGHPHEPQGHREDEPQPDAFTKGPSKPRRLSPLAVLPVPGKMSRLTKQPSTKKP